MLFPCPEEGCVKAYSRFANLQTHPDTGKHQMILEQETLYDKAKREYSSNSSKLASAEGAEGMQILESMFTGLEVNVN